MRTVRGRAAALVVVALGTAGSIGCSVLQRAPRELPSNEATATPSASATTAGVRLTPPSYRLATFPLKPTWEPSSLGRRQVAFTLDYWFLTYKKDGRVTMEVTVGWQQPTEGAPSDGGRRVTVSGRSALIEQVVIGDSDPNWAIMWQRGSGEWVFVTGRLSEADTLRYARAMVDAPLTVAPPFEFALLPDRYVPAKITDAAMEFVPPDYATNPDQSGGLGVWLRPTTHDEEAKPTTVDGRPAEYRTDGPGGPWLAIDLGDGRQLVVSYSDPPAPEAVRGAMSLEGLVTIARGVTISPTAGVTAG